MNGKMYRGKARREDCTEGRQGEKNVLIIGHEGKTVQRESKEGRIY